MPHFDVQEGPPPPHFGAPLPSLSIALSFVIYIRCGVLFGGDRDSLDLCPGCVPFKFGSFSPSFSFVIFHCYLPPLCPLGVAYLLMQWPRQCSTMSSIHPPAFRSTFTFTFHCYLPSIVTFHCLYFVLWYVRRDLVHLIPSRLTCMSRVWLIFAVTFRCYLTCLSFRCGVLVDAVTETVFNYVRRGLFERDKLTVATMLTLKILVNDNLLAQEEVDYLVMSKVWILRGA